MVPSTNGKTNARYNKWDNNYPLFKIPMKLKTLDPFQILNMNIIKK